jgi:hypothetical protein
VKKLSPDELKAAALHQMLEALELIEAAQNNLAGACQKLSALQHGAGMWSATWKLHERVKAHWYRVDTFRHQGRFKLDQANVDALQLKSSYP